MRINDTPDQYKVLESGILSAMAAMSPTRKQRNEQPKKNGAAGGGPDVRHFAEVLGGGGGGLDGSTMFFSNGSGSPEPHFGQFVPPMCVFRSNDGAKIVLQIGH